jgi:hypothetical protein
LLYNSKEMGRLQGSRVREEQMKLSKPPAVATWTLEHLVGGERQALAGDLLEEFRQGRSASWYWRQVLVAIFTSRAAQLRILWVAAGFTIARIGFLHASSQWLLHISRGRLFQTVFAWGLGLAWPLSEIYAITFFAAVAAIPLLISLTMYLGATRNLNVRVLAQGILVGMVGFAFSYVGLMLLPTPENSLAGTFAGHVIVSLPLFVGLVLSLWTVWPTASRVTTPLR